MKKLLLITFFCAAVLLLAGCGSSAEKTGDMASAGNHLAKAQQCRENPEHLALAIWHYEQFLKSAENTGGQDAALAEIQLTACRELYRQRIAGDDPADAAQVRDLQMKLRNLEQRNADLQSWISRLHTENRALREAHIDGAVKRRK